MTRTRAPPKRLQNEQARSESDYVECECDKERMTQFAQEIGCDI